MALTDNTTGGRIIDSLGMGACRIVLSDTVEVGDMLGVSSDTWIRALATTPNQVDARLVAGQAGVSGDTIVAYPMAKIGGLTGMTKGKSVYVAEAALKGEVTETAPTTTGDVNAPIGISLTATEWLAYPGFMPVYHDADHRA